MAQPEIAMDDQEAVLIEEKVPSVPTLAGV